MRRHLNTERGFGVGRYRGGLGDEQRAIEPDVLHLMRVIDPVRALPRLYCGHATRTMPSRGSTHRHAAFRLANGHVAPSRGGLGDEQRAIEPDVVYLMRVIDPVRALPRL